MRIESLFTALIDLRDALLTNDTDGVTPLLEKRWRRGPTRPRRCRGITGAGPASGAGTAAVQEDMAVLDEKTRSELQDLDYTEAAVRLGLLQTQMQAGLQALAMANGLSLLDFLA